MTTHSKDRVRRHRPVRIYFPSIGWSLLPATAVATLFLIILASLISLFKSGDWSMLSIKLHILTALIMLSLAALFLVIAYGVLMIITPFCMIEDDSLILITSGKAEEYALNDIHAFEVATIASLSRNRFYLKIKFYILDNQNQQQMIFTNVTTTFLRRAWVRTARKFEAATARKVSIQFFVENPDGHLYDLRTYQMKQVNQDQRSSRFNNS